MPIGNDPRRLTDRDLRVIRELSARRVHVKEIAAIMGITRAGVIAARARLGIVQGSGSNTRPDVDTRVIVRAYQRGVPIATIAQVYGCCTKTIHYRLHRAGVTVLPPGKAPARPRTSRRRSPRS